jgi:hypothetical protein
MIYWRWMPVVPLIVILSSSASGAQDAARELPTEPSCALKPGSMAAESMASTRMQKTSSR